MIGSNVHSILKKQIPEKEKLKLISEIVEADRKDVTNFTHNMLYVPLALAINSTNAEGSSPLAVAASNGYLNIVEYLLEQKETHIYLHDYCGNNVLHKVLFGIAKIDEEDEKKRYEKFLKITKLLLAEEAKRRLSDNAYKKRPFLEMEKYNIGSGFAKVLRDEKTELMPEIGSIIEEVEAEYPKLKELKEKIADELNMPLLRYKPLAKKTSFFEEAKNFFTSFFSADDDSKPDSLKHSSGGKKPKFD